MPRSFRARTAESTLTTRGRRHQRLAMAVATGPTVVPTSSLPGDVTAEIGLASTGVGDVSSGP